MTIERLEGISVRESTLELRTGRGCMHLWLWTQDKNGEYIKNKRGLSFQSSVISPHNYPKVFELMELWAGVKGEVRRHNDGL